MRTIVAVSLAAALAAAGLAAAAPADAAYKAKVSGGTLKITGNGAGDKLALRLQQGNRNVLVVDVKANGSADFSFDRSTFRRIVVNAGAGNDTVSVVEKNGAFTNKEKTTLNGGRGRDLLVGGRFGETFAGGLGDDTISGKKGGDRMLWTAGEGSDKIDGDQGSDVLTAEGSAGVDSFVIAPVGVRVSLSSGSGALNIGKVERIVANGRGSADILQGQPGLAGLAALTLNGGSANDIVGGGDSNDSVRGGDGDDIVTGGAGNDTLLWSHGDDTDAIDGNDGTDVLKAAGSGGPDNFTVTANGLRVRIDQLNTGAALDLGTTERLELSMLGGNDTVSNTGNLAALIAIVLDSGTGADTILGSNGTDTLRGGDGNDFVDGQQGNDTIVLGRGNDVAQWDPGDGSDKVEGGLGTDRLAFNGSNGNEVTEAAAIGQRVRFTRNLGNIVMDLNDLERLDNSLLGGTDTTTIGNLAGTDLKTVNVRLSGTLGGASGDGQTDTVSVDGTSKKDTVKVAVSGTRVDVTGLPAVVHVFSPEPADRLQVNGLGQADKLTAGAGLAPLIGLTLAGGAGADVLTGGDGADIVDGGDGNDVLRGGSGQRPHVSAASAPTR